MTSNLTVYDRCKAELGIIPDADLARKVGCTRERIRQLRLEHGLCRPGRPKGVVPYEALLGTVSDHEIARRFGVCQSAVYSTRRRRGIPAFHPDNPNAERYRAAWDFRQTGASWREVAERWGFKSRGSANSILYQWAKRHDWPNSTKRAGTRIPNREAWDFRLSGASWAEVARRFGYSRANTAAKTLTKSAKKHGWPVPGRRFRGTTVAFYCPSCGQTTRAVILDTLAPLAPCARCCNCGTLWRFDFREAGEPDEDGRATP